MSEPIRCLIDGRVHEIAGVEPTMTVLEYLRTVARRCGTKEGCAEGDCGACTVVLAEPDASGLAYRAVNSCIQFVPTLDGKQLITVEDLQGADGGLHPIQRALVEQHGSQCGFCTPGFVMALFALQRSNGAPSRDQIEEALAGNLCRCTGYRPILDAAQAMGPAQDQFAANAADTARSLRGLQRAAGLAYEADGKRFWAPQSKAELFAILAEHPDTKILSGGTDFGLWVTKQHHSFAKIVYLGRIAELAHVTHDGDALVIGGAASWSDALPPLAAMHADLGAYLQRFASVQIRNTGTLGGNIANGSPIGDGPPVLTALGAQVVLENAQKRRSMALEDFFLDYRKTALQPGEIVSAIRVPALPPSRRFAAYKLSKRFDQDISAVALGIAIDKEDGVVTRARLGFGGMAATPKRARHAEAALTGQRWSLASIQAAMAALDHDFTPMTDMRGSAGYRLRAARNLLIRFYHETADPSVATRVLAHG
jgi:xanthine dehydrogenase small subunit